MATTGRNQPTFDSFQNMYTRPNAAFSTYSAINTGASSNAVNISAVAGYVYGIDLMNNDTNPVYFKLYDKATAPSSLDTPVRRYMIPGAGGLVRVFVSGLAYTLGLGFRLVTGIADNSVADAAASTVLINIDYGAV